MTKRRLIVVGPLPPPLHGVTVSTSLVLANPRLHERFDVRHLDTSDHRSGRNTGRWDLENIALGVQALIRLIGMLSGRVGAVYIPISQNAGAFLRDSLLLWAAHLRGWRVAIHLRGSDFQDFYERSPRLYRAWIRSTLRRVESAAVMGESLRWVFDGLVAPERIVVVPNGTPPLQCGDVDSDPDHVLFLGNLRRRKGVTEAVEAALLVRERRPATRFTFAGSWESDELERTLRRQVSSHDGSIVFRGSVEGPEKDALLASASVLLFPPVEPEGHPRVVLEAMAAGVPVVTTNRGAIAETVGHGACGFVLDDARPTDLAESLLLLLEDAGLRRSFGLAARRTWLERFTQGHADDALAQWLSGVARG